jgi:hypothetical protein
MSLTDAQKRQGEPSDAERAMKVLAGPALLDRAMRHSVQHCWMMLPAETRSAAVLAAEMRRRLDRALHDLEAQLRDGKLRMPEVLRWGPPKPE